MSVSNTTKRVKEIRRKTRRKFSSEEKIHIVLEGLRGECSIAELCRREGILRKDDGRAFPAQSR
jgi:transposase